MGTMLEINKKFKKQITHKPFEIYLLQSVE